VSGARTSIQPAQPSRDCPLCPRLAAFRQLWREREPSWHNAPVPTFGPADAPVLIVGLAPGLRGANRTGRPFTGDFAGDVLYPMLLKFGFAVGEYRRDPADGLQLRGVAISNAVRCVPPENKPTPEEIRTCRVFLEAEIAARKPLWGIVVLGRVAHESVLRALGHNAKDFPFAHGAVHHCGEIVLYDSYHCSRQNVNTGTLTLAMFEVVFARLRAELDAWKGRNERVRGG
jgi:uracil-DNA glycosylase family 4